MRIIVGAIMALFLIRNITVPHGYDVVIGNCDPPMFLNYFIWFVCNDLMFILCALAIAMRTKMTAAYLFLWATIGKLIQEFVWPYGYGWFELMWDVVGLCVAILLIVHKHLNTNVTAKRNNTIEAN